MQWLGEVSGLQDGLRHIAEKKRQAQRLKELADPTTGPYTLGCSRETALNLGHPERRKVRHVTLDEEGHHAHTRNNAQILATVRNTAINLHRLAGADNIAEACRATALTADLRLDLLNPQIPSPQAC